MYSAMARKIEAGGVISQFGFTPAVSYCGGSHHRFKERNVQFYCDNMGVVKVNFLSTFYIHVPGICNSLADALSHLQWERFHQLAPKADV